MPQLDGMRFFAVAVVACEHWLLPGHPLKTISMWGTVGVWLFFVLSGYLITGILLRCRDAVVSGTETLWFVIRQFYIRRALRIFPAYYAVLAVVVYLNLPGARDSWLWHATYLSNFWNATGDRTGAVVGHFWTLAIEEQFYLFWPLVVLLVPRRFLSATLIALIAVCIAGTWLAWKMKFWGIIYLLPTHLPMLGLGALAAVCAGQKTAVSVRTMERIFLAVSLPLLAIFITDSVLHGSSAGRYSGITAAWAYSTVRVLAVGMLFAWMVSVGSRGFRGPARYVLEFAPIRYIGKISYGIYLWHIPVIHFAAFLWRKAGLDITASWYLKLTVVTLVLAMVSWHLFEGPINSLKKRFPYVRKRAEKRPDQLAGRASE